MSQKLPNMLESAIAKVREMVDANVVVGQPISVDNITVVPISQITVGLGGAGSDFASKNNGGELPFGGGVGAGIKVTPVAFMSIKDGNVRVLPMAAPANTAADRLVELIPDALDKIVNFIDSHVEKKEKEE